MICVYVKVPLEFMCHFLGQVLRCAYTICSYDQIIIIIIIIIIILAMILYARILLQIPKFYRLTVGLLPM